MVLEVLAVVPMPSPSDSSVSWTTRVYSPGGAVTENEYGDWVQHSRPS